MSSCISCWRIAVEGRDYPADDRSGKGAELTGGRWNRPGIPVLYTSENIALACLETLVHLEADHGLPLNRYLVRLDLPADAWQQRRIFDPQAGVGWDAEPHGQTSLDWGSHWLEQGQTLIAYVPSTVVPEESNLLLNPRHPDMAAVQITKVRRWLYDRRLGR